VGVGVGGDSEGTLNKAVSSCRHESACSAPIVACLSFHTSGNTPATRPATATAHAAAADDTFFALVEVKYSSRHLDTEVPCVAYKVFESDVMYE